MVFLLRHFTYEGIDVPTVSYCCGIQPHKAITKIFRDRHCWFLGAYMPFTNCNFWT
jgi:hypothetical protein